MRYDKERQIYADCRFCHGEGCLACEGEANRAYKREFPNGPEPIATFKTDSPRDMELLKKSFGASALKKAFGPGGGGISAMLANLKRAEGADKDGERA